MILHLIIGRFQWTRFFSFPGPSDLDWISDNTTDIVCEKLSTDTPAYCGPKSTTLQEQYVLASQVRTNVLKFRKVYYGIH
jgi:hypothetical protein